MAQQVLEGTWEEISRDANQLAGRRVRVIVLGTETNGEAPTDGKVGPSNTMISRGMFPQLRGLTDADFEAAEFHGDPDDGRN